MTINEAVKNAIQANLPAIVAGELSEYLQNAEAAFKEVESLKHGFDHQRTLSKALQKEVEELRDTLAVHRSIAIREAEVREAEITLETRMLKLQLSESEKRNEGIRDMAMTAFRNPRIMEYTNETGPSTTSSTGYITSPSSSKTFSKEIV